MGWLDGAAEGHIEFHGILAAMSQHSAMAHRQR